MKKVGALLIALMILCLPLTSFANIDVNLITRANFITDILKSTDVEITEVSSSSFTDVTDPEYISYIETAYDMGLIYGYGQKFRPNDHITKEEAICIIVRMFGEKEGLNKTTEEDIKDILTFTDSLNISNWSKSYITYALKSGLIKTEENVLSPKSLISEKQAVSLIETAKEVYDASFTRNGMTASEMIVFSTKKLSEYDTYKQKGSMVMNIKILMEGMPQDEVDDPEFKEIMDKGIDMNIEIEALAQNPDKAYVKEVIKPQNAKQVMPEQNIEIFINGLSMYTKVPDSDKWIMQDISPLMEQIQSASPNNDPYKMAHVTDEQLEIFKEFAKFEDDEVIDGKEYFVISISIDKESYREAMMEMFQKNIDSLIQIQSENPEMIEENNFDPDIYRQMMLQIVNQMEVEVGYKYYLDKETLDSEKMWVMQDMYMPMSDAIKSAAEMSKEEIPGNILMEMLSHTEGQFDIYDFNKKVTFPVINDEDILDLDHPQM